MTNAQLKAEIEDMILDEEVRDMIIVLEGDEFADGCIGITDDDNRLVYSYERLIESLGKVYGSDEAAIDWLEYNTIRSLPYLEREGIAPLIVHEFSR